jgi:two-component sensor histidine kinase
MTRIPTIRRAIVSERSHPWCLVIVVVALLAATAAREALSYVQVSLIFVTYFPAVMITSLLTGWRYGVATALLAGVVASMMFSRPPETALVSGLVFPVIDFLVFLTSCALIIVIADGLRRALGDLDHASEMAALLNRELQHRVANMLAVVQGLASQSAKAASPEAFAKTFGARLQALARAHALLGTRSLETCSLRELIDQACQPFCSGENITRTGPPCELPAASCIPLVLALHELCTNAIKYGALSNPEGKVEITWAFSDAPAQIVIRWEESGGPPVSKPTRKGLGTALLQRQPGIAAVEMSYNQAGLCCRLTVDGAKPLSGAPLAQGHAKGSDKLNQVGQDFSELSAAH